MSVNSLKPSFSTKEQYLNWRLTWKTVYIDLSNQIKIWKMSTKEQQRMISDESSNYQKKLLLMRKDATKMMTLLSEAKQLRDRIIKMKSDIIAQPFPLSEHCKSLDFYFNKASIQYSFLPSWVVKFKGKTYYVNNVSANATMTTKERPDHPSTKGLIRWKDVICDIDKNGEASISSINTA